jgi:biotin-(acetyl-CoA carboxylase) ligase
VTLREVGDAFAHAVEIAPAAGAGTLVYVGRFDLAEFAVVLEPDEPLRIARRAFNLAMNALVDALLAYAPPEKPVSIDWPDAIRVDGGLVGGGRFAWPKNAREDAPPDWLVFGAMIRTVSMTGNDPGLHPMGSTLDEEGFTDVESAEIVRSFAHHLMRHIDNMHEYGFGRIAQAYLERLSHPSGVRFALDETGDLLVQSDGQNSTERLKLTDALAAPSWLDQQTRGPRT